MAVDAVAAPTDRRQLGGRAAGAIVDQFVVAGTSFVLMILVRKKLGSAALGEYAVLINAMNVITAMQTSWVGDSITVMDRFAARVRSAAIASQLAFIAIAIVVGALMAREVADVGGAVLFGCMVACWITEELGRRLLMARQEFWQLVLNDVVYAGGAFAGIAVLRIVVGHYSVTMVVGAMAIGAAASIVAALLQLPGSELRYAAPQLAPLREMAAFGVWRSAQTGIRQLELYVVRILVIVIASKAVLGDLEGARLFTQPAVTYVSGVASFLLPLYTEDERHRRRTLPVPLATALLVAPVALYGVVVIALKTRLAGILLTHHAHVSTVAIIGWLMFAVMFAAGQPVANLLVARRRSREIFWVRALDCAVGLGLAVPLLVMASPDLAPFALAGGMLLGVLALAWLAVRTAPPIPRGSRRRVSEAAAEVMAP